MSIRQHVQETQGVRVTRPLRTILDLLASGHVDKSQIGQAIDDALRRGLVTRKQIDSLPNEALRNSFREFAGQRR